TGPFSPSEDPSMRRLLLSALLLGGGTAFCRAAEFEPPVRLKVGGRAIRVESPGYAFPSCADIHGHKHLLVGQFSRGKIQVYRNLGGAKFVPGKWLQAEGKVAEVPGVW